MEAMNHITSSPRHPRHPRRHTRGLTLIEILFALVVMLIGLTAIASIFPLAVHVQSSAFDEIIADQVARNAESMIRARGFSLSSLGDSDYGADRLGYDREHWLEGAYDARRGDASGGVFPIGGDMCWWSPDGTGSKDTVPVEERWHLEDRSFPSAITDPTKREFYWTPMLRDNNVGIYLWDMVAYVMVMKSAPNTNYGTGGQVNWNDPVNVPKVRQNRLGVYTTSMDGYHNAKMRIGSWGLLQQFPSTTAPVNSSDKRNTYRGDVSMIPEAQPAGGLYQNVDGWFREWLVPPGEANDPEGHSRRESPLKRVRLFGGEFLRP